jgi:hypothetical protein
VGKFIWSNFSEHGADLIFFDQICSAARIFLEGNLHTMVGGARAGAGGPGWSPALNLLPLLVILTMMKGSLTPAGFGRRAGVPRTRGPSQWGSLYSHMRPDEFRRHFRLPRPLFDEIVEELRPSLPVW